MATSAGSTWQIKVYSKMGSVPRWNPLFNCFSKSKYFLPILTKLHLNLWFSFMRYRTVHSISHPFTKKSCIRETLNLSTGMDNSTNTKGKEKNGSCFRCKVAHVTCHGLRVICHKSLTPTATGTDPPPANSSIMHSRMLLLILT